MKLRDATIEDLSLLRHWDEQPHVIAADPNDDWQWEAELLKKPDWRKQLIAEMDGRPIGFVEVIDPQLEESHYWGEIGEGYRAIDIWLGEKNDLGKGYGTQIMNAVIKCCFKDTSVNAIVIDPLESNHKARRFYERLGFRFVERRTFGKDQCAVYQLDRENFN